MNSHVLTASLMSQEHEDVSCPVPTSEARQYQEYLLGTVIVTRAHLRSYEEDGETALALSQHALTLLSAQNLVARAHAAGIQLMAYYSSSANNAMAAIQSGFQAISLAQATEQPTFVISYMGTTALHMIGTGQLHEAKQLTQQAILLGTQPGKHVLYYLAF